MEGADVISLKFPQVSWQFQNNVVVALSQASYLSGYWTWTYKEFRCIFLVISQLENWQPRDQTDEYEILPFEEHSKFCGEHLLSEHWDVSVVRLKGDASSRLTLLRIIYEMSLRVMWCKRKIVHWDTKDCLFLSMTVNVRWRWRVLTRVQQLCTSLWFQLGQIVDNP